MPACWQHFSSSPRITGQSGRLQCQWQALVKQNRRRRQHVGVTGDIIVNSADSASLASTLQEKHRLCERKKTDYCLKVVIH